MSDTGFLTALVWVNGESYQFDRTQITGEELREILALGSQELWVESIFGDRLVEGGDVINLYSGIVFYTK